MNTNDPLLEPKIGQVVRVLAGYNKIGKIINAFERGYAFGTLFCVEMRIKRKPYYINLWKHEFEILFK